MGVGLTDVKTVIRLTYKQRLGDDELRVFSGQIMRKIYVFYMISRDFLIRRSATKRETVSLPVQIAWQR